MTGGTRIGDGDILLIIDVQNDFCPGGALPVPHGDGASRVFVCGLAFDFCVRYSAEDARGGFAVSVFEGACRGLDVQGSVAATRASLAALGVQCIAAAMLA